MFFRIKGKKKYIKRAFILTLAGVVAVGTILATTNQAMARPTLPGVEKIIQDNSTENPFVILEILPDMEDAALGYLVAGEEPVDASGKSIKDMPSSDEREAKFAVSNAADRIEDLGIEDAVSYSAYAEPGNGKKSVDIRGVFERAASGGDYKPTDSTQLYTPVQIVAEDVTPGEGQATLEQINRSNKILYREYMSFSTFESEEAEEDELGNVKKYKMTLSVLEDTEIMPVELADDVYNAQFWVTEEIEYERVTEEEPEDGGDGDDDLDSGDGDGDSDDEDDESEVEWTTSLEVGDLIFKVEESEDGVPTVLSYVGVLESEAEVAMFSFRRPNLEEEGVLDEEVLDEDNILGEGDEILGEGEEVSGEGDEILGEGDIPDSGSIGSGEGSGTPGSSTGTPGTPNAGSGETSEGSGTPGSSTETTKTPNSGSENQDGDDKTPGASNSGSENQKGDNSTPTGTPGVDDQVRALLKKGIFVPTQIGQMYRMSIRLDDIDDIITEIENGERYVVVKEADGGDTDAEYYYYISGIEETNDGDMSSTISYGEMIRPSGGYQEEKSEEYLDEHPEEAKYIGKTFYTYNDTSLPYTYAPTDGTFTFRADYTQEVYDTVSYEGGFVNEEWFKKYVFDLEESQFDDMSIDVVPVTMSELTQELLDKADLIYFADANGNTYDSLEEGADIIIPDGKWVSTLDFDDSFDAETKTSQTNPASQIGVSVTGSGSPERVDRDGGKALYLDGTDHLELSIGNLQGATELTVSFLMKPSETGRADWAFYAAPNDSTQEYRSEKYIGVFQNSQTVSAERYYSETPQDRPASAQGGVQIGNWNHVAAVFTEEETILYINGQEVDRKTSEVALSDILSSNGAVMYMGRANWGTGEYFHGYMDDYTIANYAMSAEDIRKLAKTENIYNAVLRKASEGVPVALDCSLYTNDGNDITLRKMAACLMHEDILEPLGNAGLSKTISSLSIQDLDATMKQPANTGVLTFVNGNVFVYDSANKSRVVSGDFAEEIFADTEIAHGFTELIEEIQNENFYREVAGKDELIDEKVTMATAIRHIINYGDRRNVTKTTLRVLDLEPYDFEDYYEGSEERHGLTAYEDIWYKNIDSRNSINVNTIEADSICLTDGKLDKKRWIMDNLAPQFEDNPDDLSVTIMGSREYIGKIEDINENYDLIYLGMDTSIMNTQIDTVNGRRVKTDKTVYNDSDMNGLVYTHVGDQITMNSGIINNTDNRYIRGSYRMSGNDITFDKVRELKEYIEAGYAVIISDEMVIKAGDSYTVNKEKIDKTSNMYKLLNDVILKKVDGAYRYFGKNVNVKSAFEGTNASAVANREKFSRYMGISKLTLEYSEADLPVMYNEGDGVADYLPMDSDGIYRLKYRIKLRNDAAVDLTNTNYNCRLYVDIDADGRYSEDEALTGLRITDGGSEKIPDESGEYHLSVGHTYEISRSIPEGYTGFIAWKLVFEQNSQEYDEVSERALVRSAVEGYSAVPHSGEKPQIKILQITNADGNTNLNLKTDKDMQSYYKDSKLDFGIDVTVISAKEFVRKTAFSNKTHAEYLKEYDMLVMGFFDSYKIGEGSSTGSPDANTVDAMLAIREYALSGRSILFTHDLSGFNITDDSEKTWSWYANRYLRDIQGMDRFGIMAEYNTIPSDDKYLYQSVYDTALLEGKEYTDTIRHNGGSVERYEPMALNNVLLANNSYRKNATYGETSRRASSVMDWSWEYTSWGNHQNLGNVAVSQVNRGQITEYPYKISENFNVSGTHSQYMQLNLDTDSRDEYTNDDIVVWYTLDKRNDDNLKDSIYTAVEKDVRNNYFIFNKGNITYTGSGHRSVTSQEEKRLFLNTLVAAYRTGMHAPRVMYKENEWETSATITSQYLPYDPNMNDGSGGFLEEQLPVHFYTTNVNLQKTNESLYAKYYVDGAANNYDIYLDGKYYKEIIPSSVRRLVEVNGSVVKADEEATRLTNNSMHTAMFSYADIGLGNQAGIKDKYSTNIYIRVGYEELADPAANKELSLPASESFSKLNIVCTQLFELR